MPDRRIRVAHLTSVHTPFDTRIFYKELQSLSKAGYDVVLIAAHTHDEVVDGVRVRAVPKPTGRFERIVITAWRVVKLARQENADLYHIHDPELLLWSQLLRLRGKTVIFDIHENVAKDILSKPWIHPSIRGKIAILYRIIQRILMWRMPVIFAENSYLDDYQWVDRRHVTILNMPLTDHLQQILEPRKTTPTLGYLGGVRADRGSLTTLKALLHLKQMGYTVEWDCIGPLTETHRSELEAFIRDSDLKGVHIHGYHIPYQAYRIIARCHVGLAVLTPKPNFIHSYPTKMFEYMALGLPVIVSGFPLYREVVEGAGCGICLDDPTKPQDLVEAIQWILDHPQEAEAMGQRGREAVAKHYNWKVEAEKLRMFYSQLVKESD